MTERVRLSRFRPTVELEEKGIKVIEEDFPDTLSGMACEAKRPGNRPSAEAIVISKNLNVERNRFTLLVSKRQLATMLNVDTTTIDRWRRANNFPRGITITDQCVRWRLSDVEEWLGEKERDR